jgi:VWFA-related protein
MRSRFSTLTVLLTLLTVGAVAQQPAPQPSSKPEQQPPSKPEPQPPITFKVEVNYVEIDAVVTDNSGNFVRNLTRDDFEVIEQSKPQNISVFSLVDIPVERPDAPLFQNATIERDVATNRREFEGRVFVLVLDDLHTHPSRSIRVRTAARQFVERYLGENDVAAVITTGGSKYGSQNFTSSRRLLLKAVDSFMGQKLRSQTLEKIDQLGRQMPGSTAPTDPLEMERAYKARSSLDTLRSVADFLNGIRGRRKAVVFFSEGIDYDITNAIQNRDATTVIDAMNQATQGATRANVSYYSVDPRGLSGFEDAIELTSTPEDNSLGVHTMLEETRLAQDSLRTLSEETGGFAAINRNDYRDTFARIIRDNSSYYVLGYYSSDTKRDGRFRPVDVRVRRPGLQVRARKGYTPPRTRLANSATPSSATTSPDLREALRSPLAVSGLGLSATAAAFRGAGDKASVAVTLEIDGSRFKFADKGDRASDEVEVSMVAFDAKGVGRDGGRDSVGLTLRPQTRDAVISNGVRITRRFEVIPGSYHLRIGAREAGSASLGTVTLDIEVPDFSKDPLVMSGLVITSAGSNRTPTVRPDEQLKDVLPAPATTVRDFSRDDDIATFVEVYDNQTRTPHRVEVKTSVLADDGKVVFNSAEERRSEEIGPSGGGYGHTVKIPLKTLAAGRYVLRVEARALITGGGTAMRELEFRVR